MLAKTIRGCFTFFWGTVREGESKGAGGSIWEGRGKEGAYGKGRIGDEREKKEGKDVIANKYLLLKHVLPMSMLELIAGVARGAVGVGMTPSFWSPSAQ